MTLETKDCEILRRPFKPEDHEFKNGYAYVAELAVCQRLEEVDASYDFRLVGDAVQHNDVGSYIRVAVKAAMTVKGVTRENYGMHKVEPLTRKWDKKKDGYVDLPENEWTEVGEPEKAAATDALRRTARLFGVGQYLLNCPGWVGDVESMRLWLDNGMPQEKPAPRQNRTKQPLPAPIENGQGNTRKATLRPVVTILAKDNGGFYMKFETIDGEEVFDFDWGTWERANWCYEGEWRSAAGKHQLAETPIAEIYETRSGQGTLYLRVKSVNELKIPQVEV